MLATSSMDAGSVVRLWDLRKGTFRVASSPLDDSLRSFEWSPDGAFLAAVQPRGCVIFDVSSGSARVVPLGFLEHASWSPDSKRFAAGSDFGNVDLIDPKTGHSIHARPELRPNPAGLASPVTLTFSPDSSVLVVEQEGKPSELWDAVTGKPRATFASLAVQFSTDSTRLAILGMRGGLTLADGHTAGKRTPLRKDGATDNVAVAALAFSGDGKHLAWAPDESLEVWDVEHAKLVASLSRKDAPKIQRIAISHDGARIAFSTESNQLFLLTPGSTAAPTALGACDDASFSPDDARLSCTSDPSRVFDGRTGAALAGSVAPRGRAFGPSVPYVLDEEHDELVRLADGVRLSFREASRGDARVPFVITDRGYFQGDREALRSLLARTGEGGKDEPPTDADLDAHERPTLVADFAAGAAIGAR
jgi:hypothetical protein